MHLRLHQTTWLWAVRTSVILSPAPTFLFGIRATLLPSVLLFPTFLKSRGTIPAQDFCCRNISAISRPTVSPACATTFSLVRSSRPRLQAGAGPAAAPRELLLQAA